MIGTYRESVLSKLGPGKEAIRVVIPSLKWQRWVPPGICVALWLGMFYACFWVLDHNWKSMNAVLSSWGFLVPTAILSAFFLRETLSTLGDYRNLWFNGDLVVQADHSGLKISTAILKANPKYRRRFFDAPYIHLSWSEILTFEVFLTVIRLINPHRRQNRWYTFFYSVLGLRAFYEPDSVYEILTSRQLLVVDRYYLRKHESELLAVIARYLTNPMLEREFNPPIE